MSVLRVEVTSSDIEKGVRGSPSSCPVALAIKRRGVKGVRVGMAGIYLPLSADGRVYVDLISSPSVSTLIAKYDVGGRWYIEPFTLRLSWKWTEEVQGYRGTATLISEPEAVEAPATQVVISW